MALMLTIFFLTCNTKVLAESPDTSANPEDIPATTCNSETPVEATTEIHEEITEDIQAEMTVSGDQDDVSEVAAFLGANNDTADMTNPEESTDELNVNCDTMDMEMTRALGNIEPEMIEQIEQTNMDTDTVDSVIQSQLSVPANLETPNTQEISMDFTNVFHARSQYQESNTDTMDMQETKVHSIITALRENPHSLEQPAQPSAIQEAHTLTTDMEETNVHSAVTFVREQTEASPADTNEVSMEFTQALGGFVDTEDKKPAPSEADDATLDMEFTAMYSARGQEQIQEGTVDTVSMDFTKMYGGEVKQLESEEADTVTTDMEETKVHSMAQELSGNRDNATDTNAVSMEFTGILNSVFGDNQQKDDHDDVPEDQDGGEKTSVTMNLKETYSNILFADNPAEKTAELPTRDKVTFTSTLISHVLLVTLISHVLLVK